MFENKFSDILSDNEKIIKINKPNKKRMVIDCIFKYLIPIILCLTPFLIFLIYFLSISDNELKKTALPGFIIFSIVIFFVLCFPLFYFLYLILFYKNTFYAISDKRFIIRGGSIEIDYKTLNIKQVAGINARVSPLDKMIKPTTGSLTFLSSALHSCNGQNRASPFIFVYVNNPYKLNKEISQYLKVGEENIL